MQVFDPGFRRGGVNHPWLWLFILLVTAAGIAVLIWALLRSSHRTYQLPPAVPPTDPAMEVLRMRFARGEIDSDEYATRAAHLSGWVPNATQAPPGPPSP
jgi:uncharacterized membrane protein